MSPLHLNSALAHTYMHTSLSTCFLCLVRYIVVHDSPVLLSEFDDAYGDFWNRSVYPSRHCWGPATAVLTMREDCALPPEASIFGQVREVDHTLDGFPPAAFGRDPF